MTRLLSKAFKRASSLSEDLQDQIARDLLEEIEWEMRWDQTLAGSQETLDRLAEKAEQEYRAGETREHGFDDL